MRAAVRHAYGPPEVLALEEVETPTPAADEVRIRVRAASVNLGDWEMLTGRPRYITVIANLFAPKPRHPVVPLGGAPLRRGPKYRILGCDVAGTVDAVGAGVRGFHPGDEVFGDCSIAGFGGFAEHVCVPEKAALAPKPPGMSFEQAAAIPQAAFIALQGLRDRARVQAGQKVLVNGAGGGAGTFAVQLAAHWGAEVTGVDGPTKLELIRSLGARHVVDYTREDYTERGERYDVILDLASYRSVFRSRRSLTPNGIYLWAGGTGTSMLQSMLPLVSRLGNGRVKLLLADWSREDLVHMAELFEAGAVVPVIDRCYPLEEAADALRRVGEKRALGKVVITA